MLSIGDQVVRVHTGKEKTTLFTEIRHFGAEENFFKVSLLNSLWRSRYCLERSHEHGHYAKAAKRYSGVKMPWGNGRGERKNGSWTAYTIRGILADIPVRSHLQFDILVSLSSFPEMKTYNWKWIWTAFSTYGLVRDGTDIQALTKKSRHTTKWAAATTTHFQSDIQ